MQIACPQCGAPLAVDEKHIGKQGKCPHCGKVVEVLASAESQPGVSLPAATPQQMVEELARRKLSAVLVHFQTPASGKYDLAELRKAQVQCFRTADMTEDLLHQVLEGLGKSSEMRLKQVAAAGTWPADRPYELKGDPVGMSLAEFKQKHARKVPGCEQSLPWCSDSTPSQSLSALHAEPWHAAAGIVHGRLDLPFEESPTIAGAKTELLLYQFVDGRLFRISALFATDDFAAVSAAFVHKFGRPTKELRNPRRAIWENQMSTIELVLGSVRPKRPSIVHIFDPVSWEIAQQRTPKREQDV